MSPKSSPNTASFSYRINNDALKDLLSHAVQYQYHVNDGLPENVSKATRIQSHVLRLFARDYSVHVLDNSDGELGVNYPAQMALLGALDGAVATDVTRLRRLAMVARMGRCRGRFPISVILYRGRHVCRSATLSVGAEMYPRHYYYSMFGVADAIPVQKPDEATVAPPDGEFLNYNRVSAASTDWDTAEATCDAPTDGESNDADFSVENVSSSSQQLFDKIRSMDVRLLRLFGVGSIADLMVETKKVKFGLYVASSEKVDKLARYGEFSLLNIPYPGCEFFSRYCAGGYLTSQLQFNWSQKYINAELSLPSCVTRSLDCDFSQYRCWHTAELTANYLKVLLTCLHAPRRTCTCRGGCDECGAGGGVLIHCISGWDRTPLFVSLLRLSLWADGLIHQSLDPSEILFLTLAYDWFLFGHNLPDRIARDQEIMHFTFSFLKHIESEEFSASKFMSADNQDIEGRSPCDLPDRDTDVSPATDSSRCDISGLLGSTDTVTGITEEDSTSLALAAEVADISNTGSSTDQFDDPVCNHDKVNDLFRHSAEVDDPVCVRGPFNDRDCLGGEVSDPVSMNGEVVDPVVISGCESANVDADITVLSSSSSVEHASCPPSTSTLDCHTQCHLADLLDGCSAPWCSSSELAGGLSDAVSTNSLSSCQSACSSLACVEAKRHCLVDEDEAGGEAETEAVVDCWPFVAETVSRSNQQHTPSVMEESFCRLDLCDTTAASSGNCYNHHNHDQQQQQHSLSGVSPLAVRRREHRQWRQRQASSSLESLPEQRSVCEDLSGHLTDGSPTGRVTVLSSGCSDSSPGRDSSSVQQTTATPGGQRPTLSSPLHVPLSGRRRHESCGSVGSWQIVSECGSVPGSLCNDTCSHSPHPPTTSSSPATAVYRDSSPTHHTCVLVTPSEFVESTTTLTGESSDDDEDLPRCDVESSRASRLRTVRMLFLQTYGTSVGLKSSPSAPRTPLSSGSVEPGSGSRGQCVRDMESGGRGRFRLLPAVVSTLAGRVGIM